VAETLHCCHGMNANELQERTFQFALAILAFCDSLPNTTQGRTVSTQLAKARTSIGANYRSARRARTRREFASKLGIAKEEADESEYWLAIVLGGTLPVDRTRVTALYEEASQLRAIFVAAHATARRRLVALKRRTSEPKSSNP
jgi:four helix bundle protein